MRLYLDACTIIYLVESQPPFQAQVHARVAELRGSARAEIVTSRLSRLEVRTRPLRAGETDLLAAYERFFDLADVRIAEVDAAVIERATELRARHGFRSPDAIHLATAAIAQTDLFLTGDAALARCDEVKVEILSPRTGAPPR